MKRTLLTIAVAFALFGLVGTAGATTAEAPQSDDVTIQTPMDGQPQTESISATPFDGCECFDPGDGTSLSGSPFEVSIQTPRDEQPQTESVSATPFDVTIQTPRDEQPQTE